MINGRQLIYIPILHTQQDMGSLALPAQKAAIKKVGHKVWQHHVKAIDEMWAGIRKRITALKLPYPKTYLYQDGLPVCGKEAAIVKALAKRGSPNHRIIQWLVERGAQLVGTEDPRLLLQEYNHIKRIFQSHNNGHREKMAKNYEKAAPELLKKRDVFMRERIDKTLPPKGIALLFVGLLHRVDELLPADIRISYLIYRLPFRRSFEMEQVG